jgi:hypothetical protein
VHFGYIEHDVYLKIIYGIIIFISGELTHCSRSKSQHPINNKQIIEYISSIACPQYNN